jgi:hypothetical protein
LGESVLGKILTWLVRVKEMVNKCRQCDTVIPRYSEYRGYRFTTQKRKYCLSCHPPGSRRPNSAAYGLCKISNEDVIAKCLEVSSVSELLQSFNLAVSGSSWRAAKARIQELGLTLTGIPKIKRAPYSSLKLPDDEVFKLGSSVSSAVVRRKLKEKIAYKCDLCACDPIWNTSPLTLQMDHINGNRKDHSLNNLRFLCPNCHSQTPTWGFKLRYQRPLKCGRQSRKDKGVIKPTKRKFNPSREELERLVWDRPTCQVSKLFGVTDNAVGKRCKILGINKPPRGYWVKNKA